MIDLEKIQQALDADVPARPWTIENDLEGYKAILSSEIHTDGSGHHVSIGCDLRQEDAKLIVAAVNNLPELLKIAKAVSTFTDNERKRLLSIADFFAEDVEYVKTQLDGSGFDPVKHNDPQNKGTLDLYNYGVEASKTEVLLRKLLSLIS